MLVVNINLHFWRVTIKNYLFRPFDGWRLIPIAVLICRVVFICYCLHAKKSIGPPLFPCSFSPTNTKREKPLSSSRDAVIAPADIKNLHRSYAGICKCMQSACLFVSSLNFAPLRVIFKLQPHGHTDSLRMERKSCIMKNVPASQPSRSGLVLMGV